MAKLENGTLRVTKPMATAFERFTQALAFDATEIAEAKEWLRGAIIGADMHEDVAMEFFERDVREAELIRYMNWRATA